MIDDDDDDRLGGCGRSSRRDVEITPLLVSPDPPDYNELKRLIYISI